MGDYIGTEDGLAEFVENEIVDWKKDITDLAEIASSEPQLAYALCSFRVWYIKKVDFLG